MEGAEIPGGSGGGGWRQLTATRLKELARHEGFALAGVCEPHATLHGAFLREWVEAGRHGEMEYLAREDALQRREALEETHPGVRSVLVVAHDYFQEDGPGVPGDPALGVIARYARGRDYHKIMRKGLERVLRRYREEWVGREDAHGAGPPPGAPASDPPQGRIYVDTGPILERELAQRAGLGWFGRNTMLIHPRRGSYFFLGVLLLDVALEPDSPFQRDHCGSCRACLDGCPTGALLGRDGDGAPVMDATRCISYLTIENRGPIPRELRPLMGNRVYGCDICQEACPFNVRFSRPAAEPGYAARGPGEAPVGVQAMPGDEGVSAETHPGSFGHSLHPGTDTPTLVALLETALDPGAWESFSRGSAIRRAGRAGFARNVCVGLGNWLAKLEQPYPRVVQLLTRALSDPEPLVRGHAAWALGRSSSAQALQALRDRLPEEGNASVLEEIERGLKAPSSNRG
ncbi:MAG: tRNA epoxyqueuosine(34) reductase QueG [Gemmatimonadota bacterium]